MYLPSVGIAREFEFDREAYTDGKSPFIARTLDAALLLANKPLKQTPAPLRDQPRLPLARG
jgi:hypothetical protein